MTATFSSRTFNHDLGRAKKMAKSEPVFITDRGHPTYVLLSIEHYRQITNTQASILELLAMPSAAEIDFDPLPLTDGLYRPADFS